MKISTQKENTHKKREFNKDKVYFKLKFTKSYYLPQIQAATKTIKKIN